MRALAADALASDYHEATQRIATWPARSGLHALLALSKRQAVDGFRFSAIAYGQGIYKDKPKLPEIVTLDTPE